MGEEQMLQLDDESSTLNVASQATYGASNCQCRGCASRSTSAKQFVMNYRPKQYLMKTKQRMEFRVGAPSGARTMPRPKELQCNTGNQLTYLSRSDYILN